MGIYLLTIYILKLIDIAVFLDASFANIRKHYLPDFFLSWTSTGYFLTQPVLHCDVLYRCFFWWVSDIYFKKTVPNHVSSVTSSETIYRVTRGSDFA